MRANERAPEGWAVRARQRRRLSQGILTVAVVAACIAGTGAISVPAGSASTSSKDPHALGTSKLFVRVPDHGSAEQGVQLLRRGWESDAAALAKVDLTPQAVWLTGGTATQVRTAVEKTMAAAATERRTPVFVAYDIPGRDCGDYSAGGALNTADYEAWIDGVAAGIGSAKAAVLVEPDSLGMLPGTDCGHGHGASRAGHPFTDVERYGQLNYAVHVLEAKPHTSVYLDGTNSAWMGVSGIAKRLIHAGVNEAQGFFLNVSNYQYSENNTRFGTWVSECIALLGRDSSASCPGQYPNDGSDRTRSEALVGAPQRGALDDYRPWKDGATGLALDPRTIDDQYASALRRAGVSATAHFVIDTSRAGAGPNPMKSYLRAPYKQPTANVPKLESGNWCNSPGAGLGRTPTTNTGVPLVDAYLWVKTPGESDGQCNAAGAGRVWNYAAYSKPGWPKSVPGKASFDPLWGQVDPAAGAWFPAQMLDLIHHANPAIG